VITVLEGTTLRSIVTHVDPEREGQARDYLRHGPPDPLAGRGASQVIRTGQRELVTAESVFVSSAPGTRPGELAALLGFHSGVCLPLVARGRTTGALTLVRVGADQPFTPQNLGVVEELAGREAMAPDNATLYREAREPIRARDEF